MNLDTTHSDKRKSLAIATLLYAVLILIMFFIRFWPPSNEELEALIGGGGGGGVTVNFGDSDLGSGNDFQSKELEITQNTKSTATQPVADDPILTQDDEGDKTDVSIPKHEPIKNTKPIVKPEITKPIEVKKPIVRKVDDAVANFIKGNKKGGDGNDATSGNKGRSNGDINSDGYSGTGGSGGGSGGGIGSGKGIGTGPGSGSGTGGGSGSGNGKGVGIGYSLAGRQAVSKPKPNYTCNEEGTVVVQITVDKNGNVIDAKPGYRGTNNTAPCLTSQAKSAAMQTKWTPSSEGLEKQVGTITYNFKITE